MVRNQRFTPYFHSEIEGKTFPDIFDAVDTKFDCRIEIFDSKLSKKISKLLNQKPSEKASISSSKPPGAFYENIL